MATNPAGRSQSNLTMRIAAGLRWSYLGNAALMAAHLTYTATISRLLDPTAFGLIALANLVVLFTQFFVRLGIASAIVQKPELSKEDIRAAATAGIVLGAACFALIWVLSPAISNLFGEPTLSPVLRALGASCLFQGFSMTGVGLLLRAHRFRELSTITVGTYVLGFLVVGVGSAMLGAGVWSLVAASLVTHVSQVIWQYALLAHPVRPVLRWAPYRAVCGYGMRLSGAHLMDHVGSSLDTLAVGRFASAAVLGQYSRAYYLVFQPLRLYLTQALESVLFSHLSRIQDDSGRLRRAYISVLTLGSTVLFPICAGMAVSASELVAVVLGPQWNLAATIVPWFALAGGLSVISKLSQALAEARAELNRSLMVQGAYLVVLGAVLAAAIYWRSQGVWVFAAAVLVGEFLRHLGYIGLMQRILGLPLALLAQSYASAVSASFVVAITIAVVRRALIGQLSTLGILAVEVGVGALALALCIRLYPRPFVRREFRMRLTAAGALGEIGGLRWRLAPLLLGRAEPVTTSERRS